jgi:hypothetical protein
MLARGAGIFDVAKMLADTVDTVEKHYAPFLRELRARARRIVENGEGLKKTYYGYYAVGVLDNVEELIKKLYGGRTCKPDSENRC